MRTALVGILVVLCPLTLGEVLYASLRDEDQNLATRINCQVDEEQHFRYISESSLWDSMGGKILIEADVLLLCLGADVDGKYGSEALKYNIEISNLKVNEGSKREEIRGRRRRKRGARDFLAQSWRKVKNFFNRMLGRSSSQAGTKRASSGDHPTEETEPDEVSAADMYNVPFEWVQLANGSIPEIRFSEMEVEDARVKNFKRHLADSFATLLLHQHPGREVEKTLMGEHTSTYNISISGKNSNYQVPHGSTSQPSESDGAVVVVNKVVTTDDIISFAPSDALNDKERMDLRSHQMQMFHEGRMTVSRGISSLSMVTSLGADKRIKKRATEDDDATAYIRTETAFELQLRRRRRRSVEDSMSSRLKKHSFMAASRVAEVEADVREKRQLSDLQESVDLNSVLDDLVNGNQKDTEEKIQSVSELIRQEMSLKLDEETHSLCKAIRRTFTLQVMEEMCGKNVSLCKDCLKLVAMAGGPEAEELFLHFLGNTGINPPPETIQTIADILSDISRPSAQLLGNLMEMVRVGNKSPAEMGAICISLGYLASAAESDVKDRVSDLFSGILKDRVCDGDPLMIDLLEAVGNLKCDRITPYILEVSSRCQDNSAVQIASIHALRHSACSEKIEGWLEKLLRGGDCDVVKEVISSLMDKIQDQEMNPGVLLWPRFHFNKLDVFLKHSLEEGGCSSEDIILYFGRKENEEANEIAQSHLDPPPGRRQKRRALWDDLNCQEWTEDSLYDPIQKKEEFASDRATYNKRKSCLAFRKLGVKGANAEIYAGMFAGLREPISDPPKYKLFTKFVSGFNFLGQQIEVGSFYFYLHSGKTKAYVRIMGRTRQEFTNDGCTPTELRYTPLKHIPLYLVSIGNVQMSLGIHLSSRLSVDTLCPQADIYELQPLTDVRIGGEALGTVGMIRGAANLGANFNYKLQFTFTPMPSMCLKGSHGYDPMDISFESHFQLWNSVKQDWGKRRVWKPRFLSWELKRGDQKQWFDDTCIALQKTLERELE